MAMFEEREEPEPRERKLDILPPTLAEIDQRIAGSPPSISSCVTS
jgi:hypothetical protein